MFRAGAPGDLRHDLVHVDPHLGVEHGVGIARERAPVGDGLVPQRALGRIGPVLEEFEGDIVGRHHADLGAELDREIAHREPAFDLHVADRAAGIFDGVARAAGGADLADEMQDHVLGRDAGRALAVEGHAHALGLGLHQRLRRQHMDHLGGADAEGDGAHAAMGAGVAVAAHQQGARQGDALLRSHDMDDALAGLAEIEQFYAPALGLVAHVIEPRRIGFQRLVRTAGLGRDDVVEGGEGEIGIAHAVARILDRLKPAAAAVMHEMAADVQQGVAIAEIGDDVAIPNLVEQGLTGHVVFLSPDLRRAYPHPIIFCGRPQRVFGGRKDRSAALCWERATARGVISALSGAHGARTSRSASCS